MTDRDAHVDARDMGGKTALFLATQERHWSAFGYLLVRANAEPVVAATVDEHPSCGSNHEWRPHHGEVLIPTRLKYFHYPQIEEKNHHRSILA